MENKNMSFLRRKECANLVQDSRREAQLHFGTLRYNVEEHNILMHINFAFINFVFEYDIPIYIVIFVILGVIFILLLFIFAARLLYINIKPVFVHKRQQTKI